MNHRDTEAQRQELKAPRKARGGIGLEMRLGHQFGWRSFLGACGAPRSAFASRRSVNTSGGVDRPNEVIASVVIVGLESRMSFAHNFNRLASHADFIARNASLVSGRPSTEQPVLASCRRFGGRAYRSHQSGCFTAIACHKSPPLDLMVSSYNPTLGLSRLDLKLLSGYETNLIASRQGDWVSYAC